MNFSTIKQILIILILTFACRGEAFSAVSDDGLRKETTILTDKTPTAAIISSGQSNIRVHSSRPQRILPTNWSRQNRTNGKLPHLTLFKKLHISHVNRRVILLSSPLLSIVSSGDIIIALRHIVR